MNPPTKSVNLKWTLFFGKRLVLKVAVFWNFWPDRLGRVLKAAGGASKIKPTMNPFQHIGKGVPHPGFRPKRSASALQLYYQVPVETHFCGKTREISCFSLIYMEFGMRNVIFWGSFGWKNPRELAILPFSAFFLALLLSSEFFLGECQPKKLLKICSFLQSQWVYWKPLLGRVHLFLTNLFWCKPKTCLNLANFESFRRLEGCKLEKGSFSGAISL